MAIETKVRVAIETKVRVAIEKMYRNLHDNDTWENVNCAGKSVNLKYHYTQPLSRDAHLPKMVANLIKT